MNARARSHRQHDDAAPCTARERASFFFEQGLRVKTPEEDTVNVNMDEVATPHEASLLTRLCTARLRQLALEGRVRAIKTPLGRLYYRKSLLDYVESRKEK